MSSLWQSNGVPNEIETDFAAQPLHSPRLPRRNRMVMWTVLGLIALAHWLLLVGGLRFRPVAVGLQGQPVKIEAVLAAPAVAPPPPKPALPAAPPSPPKLVRAPKPVPPPVTIQEVSPPFVAAPLSAPPAEQAAAVPVLPPEPAPTPTALEEPVLPQVTITLPARATLTYDVGYGVGENLPRQARNITRWTFENGTYTIESVGEAAGLVRLLYSGQRIETSRGSIAPEGLAPTQYTEERPKRKNNVYFTRNQENSANTITFSEPANNVVPLPAGVQDRLSVQFQLGALLQAQPALREVGTQLNVTVAGARRLDNWTIEVIAQEMLQIDGADVSTLRLTKAARPGQEYDRTVELWLAPSMNWLPVRVRIAEANGKALEQTLVKVE
jgi:hypothetical protein